MPSTDLVASITNWYRIKLTQYHQVPTISALY